MDHAAYKGHVKVVELLQASDATSTKPATGPLRALSEDQDTHLDSPDERPVKQGESCIIVSLGFLGTSDGRNVVDLANSVSSASLSLEVSSNEASGQVYTVDLPVSHDLTNKPCTFSCSNLEQARITFVLYDKNSDGGRRSLGGGVAMVNSLLSTAGPDLENVARNHVAALLEGETFKHVGTVKFNLQVVKPYTGEHQAPTRPGPGWSFGNRIGGHRGNGQNKASWKFLQIGENTLPSFQTAHNLGAAFVEFDVQVTKDRVPVIYHDFLVNETGTDAPMHTITYDQFRHLSDMQCPSKANGRALDDTDMKISHMDAIFSRMSHTTEYGMKNFKANTRSAFIQDHFTTLKEALQTLPKDIPFNVEMKYPMLLECHYWKMDPNYIELNLFIDTILSTIYAHAGDRRILFSSFCPELCIAMSLKQRMYPVFFLNHGQAPLPDPRASGLQSAVHFARRWGLPGIVMESTAFVASPRLVEYVHSFGLKCATYGAQNNDPEAVEVCWFSYLMCSICSRKTTDPAQRWC